VATRRLAAWAVVALVLPALAGCASKETPAAAGSVSGGSVGGTAPSASPTVAAQPPPISGTSARWHFHDYWHGKPTIVLLDTHVNLTPALGGLAALVELPQGVIVPPEAGRLSVNVTWAEPTTGPSMGLVNLTYRPADSNDFLPIRDAENGKAVLIATTESMCDVPHRQKSLWAFNLTAKPSGDVPPGVPNTDVRVIVTATIGRPLFIDPPHFNWWQGGDTLDLVRTTAGALVTGTSPQGNVTLPDATSILGGGVPPQPDHVAPLVSGTNRSATIPASPGRIVPEGALTVVALLNWTSDAPGAPKLKLTYEEQNNPSSGPLPIVVDGAGSRVFVLPIQPPQTDTTYSNRTTWQFHVLPEGDSATAFKGTYVLTAWVTRLAPGDAVKVAQGGAAR
jgi:hypothetical protein